MNTEEIEIALRAKYAPPEYAIFFEVRNGTGFARKTERYADAIAMNLYPSRGLEIIGFEIKASRADWLRELKNPDKAEEIGKFCDRWYVVVGDKVIVKPGELPAGWGLIVPRGNGLIVSTEAPAKHAKAVDKLMVAALLRAAVNRPDLHFHDLRHGFASLLAESGADFLDIMTLLRHTSPASTKRYTHLIDKCLKRAVSKMAKAAAQK